MRWQNVRMILVRHGETEYNRKGIIMGWKPIPLSQKGKEQAHQLGCWLQKYHPHVRHVFCSDLLRAQQTAEIIISCLSKTIPVTLLESLRERKWGDFEGKPLREVRPEGRSIHAIDPPNGETNEVFHERCLNALHFIETAQKWNDEDEVLVVAHGGTIRHLLAGMFHFGPEHHLRFPARIDNCSVTIVRRKEDDKQSRKKPSYQYLLETLNSTCHLNRL